MFGVLASACKKVARDFDASTLSPSDAARTIEELGEIRRAVDAMIGQVAKRAQKTDAHLRRGKRNAAALVADALGTTTGEVNAAIRTATQLEDLPLASQAVRNGKLSALQAKLIAGAATINPAKEQELIEVAAQGLTPLKDACVKARAEVEDPDERRERQRKQRSFRHWVDDDGMIAGRFRLTPETGAAVVKKIDEEVKRLFREHKNGEHEPHDAYAADAFAEMVLAEAAPAKQSRTSKYRIHILIDHDALVRRNALPGETCEIPGVGPVHAEWVKSLLGEAFSTAIIKKGKDIRTVAHVGRYRPAEIDTALHVDGMECGIVGCYCRGYLEIDHHHEFAKGGPTKFENLEPRCSVHHDLKSRGWIEGPPDPITAKRTLRPPPGWVE